MKYSRRAVKPTKKVRQARLDFAAPGNRPAKCAQANALATPARQTLTTSLTPAQMRIFSPRTSLSASKQGIPPLFKDDA